MCPLLVLVVHVGLWVLLVPPSGPVDDEDPGQGGHQDAAHRHQEHHARQRRGAAQLAWRGMEVRVAVIIVSYRCMLIPIAELCYLLA